MLHHVLARGRIEGKDLIEKLWLARGGRGGWRWGKGEATNYEFRSLALFFKRRQWVMGIAPATISR